MDTKLESNNHLYLSYVNWFNTKIYIMINKYFLYICIFHLMVIVLRIYIHYSNGELHKKGVTVYTQTKILSIFLANLLAFFIIKQV